MQQTQKESPLLRVWSWGKDEHGRLIGAVISALAGVLLGLAGYAARTLLYNMALSISHKATFSILKIIRQKILAKLPMLPLGTVMDMSGGKMKQVIVDQVDGMETTLALLSIVTIPVGMVFMMSVMRSYGKDYEGAVKTTQEMNGTIVEYINGIEVIKAFNQGKLSYAKFAERIRANASYYYNWMKKSQFGISMGYAIVLASLVTILPVGWRWYSSGSLSAETFIMVIILSLGIARPLIAAMNFVDTLATMGTTVAAVDELLSAQEQQHGNEPVELKGTDIALHHVSFGYHADKNILRDVNFSIPTGSMTALVGPSGSGKSTIAKLIAGFWDVEEGAVMIGGMDAKKIPLKQLYDKVAFVSQDNYLFDESVRENIRMGRLSASDREVEQAARAAGCDTFIRSLEKGYETNAGSGGAHLSGGEWQRIAIARAMLKDAPIVILDVIYSMILNVYYVYSVQKKRTLYTKRV